jgi:adenine-specific DNA methylase
VNEAPRQRRALSNVGGRVRTHGDPALSAAFAHALERTATESPDAGTHGFHAWPARMHWALPATIFETLGVSGARVLDPFAGGGTVLVEAMRAGARATGLDLNPLSALVCETKCALRTQRECDAFVELAADVVGVSLERVQTRTPVKAALSREHAALYAPHVLKELAGLLEEIEEVESVRDRRALTAVFSSLVVKLSKKKADTSEEIVEKRLRKGLSSELFLRKADELARRWSELRAHVGKDAEEPRVMTGDVRRAPELLGARYRADVVLTSPPYGGTYDYHAHHALRLAWLKLDDRAFARGELGARRSLKGPEAQQRFDAEVVQMLGAIRRVVKDDGLVVLVVGDAELGRLRISPIDQLDALAPRAGLRLIAGASEEKPDYRGGHPREEHVLALAPT